MFNELGGSHQRTAAWILVGLGAFATLTGGVCWWWSASLGPLVDGWSMLGVGLIVAVVGLQQLFTAPDHDERDDASHRSGSRS